MLQAPKLALCVAALLCAALLGCERKAPGPEECTQFARTVVQLAADGPFLTQQMQNQIDDETRLCLTRPYDRELLDCVLMTSRTRACFANFKRRIGRSQ